MKIKSPVALSLARVTGLDGRKGTEIWKFYRVSTMNVYEPVENR